MSRPLRFRVWDRNEHRWTALEAFVGEGYGGLDDVHEDCLVEQFTGLTDSKGREIWEGDIISFVGGIKGAVSFGEFADSDGDEVVGWYMEGPHWNAPQVRHRYSLSSAMTATVLGNVHEHPALLVP